jgi:hypothetical protein
MQGLTIIEDLFRGISGMNVAIEAKKSMSGDSRAFLYGEVHYLSFSELLKAAAPEKGGVFYDLGSGAGRAVFSAALLHEFSIVNGVELVKPLHQLSCNLLDRFNQMPMVHDFFKDRPTKVNFINGDFLLTDIQDATVVFINATAFWGDLWTNIVFKLNQLSSGTKIILTSRKLGEELYKLIDEGQYLMSWGMAWVFTYEKK